VLLKPLDTSAFKAAMEESSTKRRFLENFTKK
jgi:hypothetical protein